MAGAAATSIIAHPILSDAMFWTAIRVLSEFSMAGRYTLIESWLRAKISNENRGCLFSAYQIADISGQIIANAIIATLTPAIYISYNIIVIIVCFVILSLALTQSKEAELSETARYKPFFAYRVSTLAAFGVIVAGLSTATLGSVGPIFAIAVGLDVSQIALFIVVSVIGSMISQVPAGILANRLSHRSVLLVYSVIASALCLAMMFSLISAAHLSLMLYTVYRNFLRPAEARRQYAYMPRTSLLIASILCPRRGNGKGRGPSSRKG